MGTSKGMFAFGQKKRGINATPERKINLKVVLAKDFIKILNYFKSNYFVGKLKYYAKILFEMEINLGVIDC